MWLGFDILLVALNHIRSPGDKQTSKQTDFIVNLTWWGLLRLTPNNWKEINISYNQLTQINEHAFIALRKDDLSSLLTLEQVSVAVDGKIYTWLCFITFIATYTSHFIDAV